MSTYKLTAADRRVLAQMQAQRASKPVYTRAAAARAAANSQTSGKKNEDKYKNANPFLRAFGTWYDIQKNISKGAGKAVEGVVDLGASLVGAVGGIFSEDFRDNVQDFIAEDWATKYYDESGIYDLGIFKDLDEYSYTNDSKVGQTVEQVAQGVGQMLPTVIVAIATGGTSLGASAASAAGSAAASTGAKAALSAAGKWAAKNAGTLALGASAAGTGMEEAYQDGASYGEGALYGLASGATEIATEKLLPGPADAFIGKSIFGKGAKEVADQGVKRVLKETARNAVNEGFEEMVSEVTNPARKSIYKGRDAFSEYSDPEFKDRVLEAGKIGALTSVAFGATVGNITKGKGYNGDIQASVESIADVSEKRDVRNAEKALTKEERAEYKKSIEANEKQIEAVLKKATPEKRAEYIERYKLSGAFNEDGSLKPSRVSETEYNTEYYTPDLDGSEDLIKEDIYILNATDGTNADVFNGELSENGKKHYTKLKKMLNSLNKRSANHVSLTVVDKNAKYEGVTVKDKHGQRIYIRSDVLESGDFSNTSIHEYGHSVEGTKAHTTLTELLKGDESLKTRAEDKFFAAEDDYGVTKDDINKILKKQERKEALTPEEEMKYEEFISERGANLIAGELGTEEFIDKIVRLDENAARKLIGKIKDMKAAIKSLESKESREKYLRLRKAEKLFLQAAEQSGNVDLARYIQSDLEDEEEDVDKESELQYNYNSKRTWAKNLLSSEDWELFKEKIGEISRSEKEYTFSDGKYLIEINNKLVISDGVYDDPSINAVIDVNADNAENMEIVIKEIENATNYREGQESIEFCEIIESRIDTSILTVYRENDYRFAASVKGSPYPTRRNDYKDFGYSREQRYGGKGNPKVKEYDLVNGIVVLEYSDGTTTKITKTEFENLYPKHRLNKKSKKIQHTYAGKHSDTADKGLLAQAEELEAQGATSEDIRKKTGWFRSYDKLWRYEIADNKMKLLKRNILEGELPLGELIEHEELFKAYPELRDLRVVIFDGGNRDASYELGKFTIQMSNDCFDGIFGWRVHLAHEIQHAIQEIEGFALGSSDGYWQGFLDKRIFDKEDPFIDELKGRIKTAREKLIDNGQSEIELLAQEARGLPADQEGELKYRSLENKAIKLGAHSEFVEYSTLLNALDFEYASIFERAKRNAMTANLLNALTAGELEAKDVGNRMYFTDEQRKNTRPDIDEPDVVFADHSDVMASPKPVSEGYSGEREKTTDETSDNNYIYTEEQYNRFGWAREAGAITFNELDDVCSKVMEKGSLKRFPQSFDGEAIIVANDKAKSTLDADDIFVFAIGRKDNFTITKVIRPIYNYNPARARKVMYDIYKKYSNDRAMVIARDMLFEDGLFDCFFREDRPSYKEYRDITVRSTERLADRGSGSEENSFDAGSWQDGRGDTFGAGNRVIKYSRKASTDSEAAKSTVNLPLLNRSQFKIYTKDNAEQIISSIAHNVLNFNDGTQGVIKDKSELVDIIWQRLNTAGEGKRGGVALDIADEIIKRTAVKVIYDDPNNAQYVETLGAIKEYIRKLNLTAIKGELEHRVGKNQARGIMLAWGAPKGERGITPDSVAQELTGQGIVINAENEADCFFEIYDLYSKAREAMKRRSETMLDTVIPENERKQLRQDIAKEILDGFRILGKKSTMTNLIEKEKANAKIWKEQYYDSRHRAKAIDHLFETVDRVRNIVDMKKADEEIAEEVENLVKLLKKVKTTRGNLSKNVREIMKEYASPAGTSDVKLYDLISDRLDGEKNPFAEQVISIAQGNGELSTREIENLDAILRNFIHNANNYKRVFLEGKRVEAEELIKQGIAETGEAMKVKDEGLLGLTNKMKESLQAPVWRFERLGCYRKNSVMMKLWREFQNGFSRQARFSMEIAEHYKEFFKKHKKEIQKWRENTYEVGGRKVSRGQMIGLYLTSLREQGRSHIFGENDNGTVRFANEKAVEKRGAHAGETEGFDTQISREIIVEFEKTLTDTEREFIVLTQTFFNEMSKNAKVETDEAMYGVSNVVDANYYPLRVADDQIYRKLGDGTFRFADLFNLYSPSFNKATVDKANNKLVIENVIDVVNRHAKQMSAYYGFARAVKTFNRVYNMKLENGDNMRSAIGKVDSRFEDYVGRLIQDIQGNRAQKNGIQRTVSKVRGWGAKAALGANLKVLASQFVSMPASAAVGVKYKNIAKGFKIAAMRKTDYDTMFKYVPMLYDRFRNGNNIDVGLLKEGTGILGQIDWLTDLTTAPIGKIDALVCCAVWNACVEQTKNGSYEIYSDEHYRAAAELTEQALIKTQANYAPLYRSEILRNQDSFVQLLTMFMGEPLQQFSLITSSVEKMKVTRRLAKNASEADKAEYEAVFKQAKSEAAHALTAVFIDTLILTAIAQLFKWVKGKEDEDKVKGIIGDFVDNYVGMIPIFKDIYNYIINGYDITNMAYTGLTNIADGLMAFHDIIDLLASGGAYDEKTVRQKLRKTLLGISQTFGIPLRNLETYATGILEKIFPSAMYEYDALFYSKSQSEYSRELTKAMENGNDDYADTILGIMLDEKEIGVESSAIRREMRTLVEAGYNVIPKGIGSTVTYDGEEITLTKKQQKRFKELYSAAGEGASDLVKLQLYRNAEEAAQAKAIKFLYDTYYNLALEEALGVDLESKNVLFAEAIDIEKLAIIYAIASGIEADKDRMGNAIAGSRKAKIEKYVESLRMSAAEKYLIMGYLGYKCKNGEAQVKAYVNRLRLSKDEKSRLMEYCGYAA